MPASHAVFSFFRYRPSRACGAFLVMGFRRLIDPAVARSGALRLMGCGGGGGFSIVPDLTRYCLVGLPERPQELQALRKTRLYRRVAGLSMEELHFLVRPASGHGSWDGKAPFAYSGRSVGEGPFAVLTLARVRPGRARAFWRQAPAVAASLTAAPGCLWHSGFGAHPLLDLATFSVWEDLSAMRDFAYRQGGHAQAIRGARQGDWLSQSLFARLEIERVEGDVGLYPALAGLAEPKGEGRGEGRGRAVPAAA